MNAATTSPAFGYGREICFDTETTGFRPHDGDRMVEIGCIELIDRMPTGRHLQLYCNPERPMPAAAFEVHGLSDSFLAAKPLFAEIADQIVDFVGDARLIAHNANFDIGFLNAELARCGRPPITDRCEVVDTVTLAQKKYPGAKASLDALCVRFGIDRSMRVKHGALLDAELLAQVYIELMGGRQIGLGLGAPDTNMVRATVRLSVDYTARRPRLHTVPADELARHRAFVDQLRDPIWAKPIWAAVDPPSQTPTT